MIVFFLLLVIAATVLARANAVQQQSASDQGQRSARMQNSFPSGKRGFYA